MRRKISSFSALDDISWWRSPPPTEWASPPMPPYRLIIRKFWHAQQMLLRFLCRFPRCLRHVMTRRSAIMLSSLPPPPWIKAFLTPHGRPWCTRLRATMMAVFRRRFWAILDCRSFQKVRRIQYYAPVLLSPFARADIAMRAKPAKRWIQKNIQRCRFLFSRKTRHCHIDWPSAIMIFFISFLRHAISWFVVTRLWFF